MTRAEEPARREVALRLEPQEAVTLSRAAPPMGLPARSLDSGHRGRTWWSLDTRGTTCPGWHPKRHVLPTILSGGHRSSLPRREAPVCPAVPGDPGCSIQGLTPTFLLWGCFLPCSDHPGTLIKVESEGLTLPTAWWGSRCRDPLSQEPSNVMHTPFPKNIPILTLTAKSGVLETLS